MIGHIALSPVTMSDGTPGWYGLGPVSVLPEYQRQRIGAALIREGLAVDGVAPAVFFALLFDGRHPQGSVAFHAGFKADGRRGA